MVPGAAQHPRIPDHQFYVFVILPLHRTVDLPTEDAQSHGFFREDLETKTIHWFHEEK